MKKKVLIGVLIALVALRVALPHIILTNLNEFLSQFSNVYEAHLDDFDLSIIRGAYRLEGVTMKLKKNGQQFAAADAVDISLSWRELLRARILTDIVIEQADVILVPEIMEITKENSKEAKADAEEAGRKLFPFRISRLDLRQSTLQLSGAFSVPEELRFRITEIGGRLSNITATEQDPIAFATLTGQLLEQGTLKAVAQFDTKAEPMRWNISIELKNFDLTKANPWLKKIGPITFGSGVLDLYSEMDSEKNRLQGYVKPFIKKPDVIGDEGDFKGLKHFGIEIGAAFAGWLFKKSETQTIATKVLFTYEAGKFQWNQSEAITSAISHGFFDKIEPGLENLYNLQKPPAKGNTK